MKLTKFFIGFFPLVRAVLITLDYQSVERPVHIIEVVDKYGSNERSRRIAEETRTTVINVDTRSKTWDIETDNFKDIIGVKLHYADDREPYTEIFSKNSMVIEEPACENETEDYQESLTKLHYQTELIDFGKYIKPGTTWKLTHPSPGF
jgi:hypothetical protein